jgi:hypothetical protein
MKVKLSTAVNNIIFHAVCCPTSYGLNRVSSLQRRYKNCVSFGEEHKLWSFLLCNFLQLLLTSSFLSSNYTLRVRSSYMLFSGVRGEVLNRVTIKCNIVFLYTRVCNTCLFTTQKNKHRNSNHSKNSSNLIHLFSSSKYFRSSRPQRCTNTVYFVRLITNSNILESSPQYSTFFPACSLTLWPWKWSFK